MTDKTKIICKAILMFLTYTLIMFALLYFSHGSDAFSNGKYITFVLFLLFGIWQSYRWTSEKLDKLKNNKN